MSLSKAREKEIRAAVVAYVAAAGNLNVFADRPLVNSKEDFVKQFFKPESAFAGGSVVKYAVVEFQNFVDQENSFCADDPIVNVNYLIHVFIEFYGVTGAAADNSHNELVGVVLDLRDAVLNTPEIVLLDDSVHSLNPLEQPSFIVNSNDTLTGVAGHYADLILQVEVI